MNFKNMNAVLESFSVDWSASRKEIIRFGYAPNGGNVLTSFKVLRPSLTKSGFTVNINFNVIRFKLHYA